MLEIPITIAAFVALTVATSAMAVVHQVKTEKSKQKALLANKVVVEKDENGVEKYKILDTKGLSEGENDLNKLLYKQTKVAAKKSKEEAKKSQKESLKLKNELKKSLEEAKKMQSDLESSKSELKALKTQLEKEIKSAKDHSKTVSLESDSGFKVAQSAPITRKADQNKKDFLKVTKKPNKDEVKKLMTAKTKVDLLNDGESTEASGFGARSTSDNSSEVSHIGDGAASEAA